MEEVTAIQGLPKCSNVYLTHYTYCPKHFFQSFEPFGRFLIYYCIFIHQITMSSPTSAKWLVLLARGVPSRLAKTPSFAPEFLISISVLWYLLSFERAYMAFVSITYKSPGFWHFQTQKLWCKQNNQHLLNLHQCCFPWRCYLQCQRMQVSLWLCQWDLHFLFGFNKNISSVKTTCFCVSSKTMPNN